MKKGKKISNAKKAKITNDVTQAILGFNATSMNPFTPGASIGTPINQVGTLFVNNRWYFVSNFRQLLSEIYVEHGIVQTVVDVPVDDGFRGGIDIITNQISPEDLKKLKNKMEQENDIEILKQTFKWNRLFGGAATMIMTNQDPATPLELSKLKKDDPLEFRAVDMWELFFSLQNTDNYAEAIDDQMNTLTKYYDYYGEQVHYTRVMKQVGMVAPSFLRPRLRGWGFSICEALVNSINQYLKSNNLIFEVLDEFKIDVYKMKNLANTLLNPNGAAAVQARIAAANLQKNFQHAVAMDSEDDFIQKELSFAGIAETMVGIRMQIASDLRMPLTKVFGISAQGFNSGEDDIENYNAMVESSIRAKAKFSALQMVQLRCIQMFGYIPDDLDIGFKPLRMLSAEQEENVKTQQFSRLFQAAGAGHITNEQFLEACNKNNLFPIQVDPSTEQINMDDEDTVGAEGTDSPKATSKTLADEAPEADV